MSSTHAPSAAQHSAIEAAHQPLLVIAGPGAGKTFCLIRRIRHLIEHGADPRRICAVTFTSKTALVPRPRTFAAVLFIPCASPSSATMECGWVCRPGSAWQTKCTN